MTKIIYEPHRQLRLGLKIWCEMLSELFQFRELIWRLFVRDFSAKYKQSLLGNFWILVMPLVAVGTFMYLDREGIVNIQQTTVPYPLYALVGLSIWQIFSIGLGSGANSLVGAGDLVTKINFPREVLVIASMAQSTMEFFIKFLLIMGVMVYLNFVPSWKMIFLPIALFPLFLLTLGLSMGLSLLNGVFRDIGNAVSLLLMFVMFLTPVLYPIPESGSFLLHLNPLSPLIDAPRDLMLLGSIRNPDSFLVSSLMCLLVFLMSWRAFHLVETKITERI